MRRSKRGIAAAIGMMIGAVTLRKMRQRRSTDEPSTEAAHGEAVTGIPKEATAAEHAAAAAEHARMAVEKGVESGLDAAIETEGTREEMSKETKEEKPRRRLRKIGRGWMRK